MEICRNRDRLNTLIQKFWSLRKHRAIPKSENLEQLFQNSEKWVGVWPLISTGFGAYTCRQGQFICTVSCRKLWPNISTFLKVVSHCWLLLVRCAGAVEGCQAWVSLPCLGSYYIRHCRMLIQVLPGPWWEQMDRTLHPAPESLSMHTDSSARIQLEEPESYSPLQMSPSYLWVSG